MAYKVEATATYEEDLNDIIGYHLRVLNAESAIRELIARLDDIQETLREAPEVRAISRKPPLAHADLREWYVKSYVLAYRIDGDTVFLEHLFHQRQNFEDML